MSSMSMFTVRAAALLTWSSWPPPQAEPTTATTAAATTRMARFMGSPSGGVRGGPAEVEAAEELGVEGHDDGRGAHQHSAERRGKGDAGPGEGAGGQGDGHDVVAGGPGQVLDHLAVGRVREADDGDDRPGVVGGEDDVGGLDGHVGAGADGPAHGRPGQGGGGGV